MDQSSSGSTSTFEQAESDQLAEPSVVWWLPAQYALCQIISLWFAKLRPKLIVIGLIAHTCVEATARFAAELGYSVSFLTKENPWFTNVENTTL